MSLGTHEAAKMVARLGVMRLGASRLNYVQPWVKVYLAGVDVTDKTRQVGFAVNKTLSGSVETASLRMEDVGDTDTFLGQELEVFVGDTDSSHRLFAGNISSFEQSFEEDNISLPIWDVSATGVEWQFTKRVVMASWQYVTVETLLTELRDGWFASWELDIDNELMTIVIDEFTATDDDVRGVLDRIVERLDASWYSTSTVDGTRTLHVFADPERFGSTHPLTNSTPAFGHSGLRQRWEAGDIITRVWSSGGGAPALLDVPVGANTIPVEDGSWYNPPDLVVHEAYTCTPNLVSGTTRFSYTGRSAPEYDGRGTSIVPRPAGAVQPPAVTMIQDPGNVAEGTYRYRVTTLNANGESDASQAVTGTVTSIATPVLLANTAVQSLVNASGTLVNSSGATQYYRFCFTYRATDGAESARSPIIEVPFIVGHNAFKLFSVPTSSDFRTIYRRVYVATPTDPTFRCALQFVEDLSPADIWWLGGYDFPNDVAPESPIPGGAKLYLQNIHIGAAGTGTTARKIYRTTKNGDTFKLLTTIADNITDQYLDNTADASLGADLTANVVHAGPGDTKLRVADLGQLPSSGWVQVGENIVHYTSKSNANGAGHLLGIPTIGYGSLTVPVLPEEPVVFLPSIEGVSGVTKTLRAGEPVTLIWRVDATANTPANTSNAFGFPFESRITDGRLSSAEARRRGIAKLLTQKDPLRTVSYTTMDQTALPGRNVTIDVGDKIQGDFRIQSVSIRRDMLPPDTLIFPKRSVEASSRRFTFTQMLRAIRSALR